MEKFTSGTGQEVWVHDKKDCSGKCCIHKPSDSHMKDWPLHWRQDKGIFERICPHNIGHMDIDDYNYKVKTSGEDKANALSLGAVCGVCFPLGGSDV